MRNDPGKCDSGFVYVCVRVVTGVGRNAKSVMQVGGLVVHVK